MGFKQENKMTEENTQNQNSDESGANQTTDTAKVAFDQAQQNKVEGLINDSYGKGFNKAKAEAAAEYESKSESMVNAEVEKRLKEVKQSQNKSDKQTGFDQEALDSLLADRDAKHSEELAKLTDQVGNLKGKDKENALLMAIGKHDTINPEHIMRLIGGNVNIDESGNPIVVDDNGQPKLNTDLKPMALSEYVTSWLADNPNFLKGSGGGGGSQGAVFGEGGKLKLNTPQDVRNMSQENFDAMIKEGITLDIHGQKFKAKKDSNIFRAARKRKFASDRSRN